MIKNNYDINYIYRNEKYLSFYYQFKITLLYMTIEKSTKELFNLLLEYGAYINIRFNDKAGNSYGPLNYLFRPKYVERLVKLGCNVNFEKDGNQNFRVQSNIINLNVLFMINSGFNFKFNENSYRKLSLKNEKFDHFSRRISNFDQDKYDSVLNESKNRNIFFVSLILVGDFIYKCLEKRK